MKSKRRHDLQTNALAALLGRWIQRYQSYLPVVGIGGAVVVVLVIAMSVRSGLARRSGGRAWRDFYLAASAAGAFDMEAVKDRLNAVVDDNPGTDVALWAKLDLADTYCFDGRLKLSGDRGEAMRQLGYAQDLYNKVLASPQATDLMFRRAALAEAKCWEFRGDPKTAIEHYNQIAQTAREKYDDTDLAKEADQRAEQLQRPGAAEFYLWLAQYKPPADSSTDLPDSSLTPPADQQGDSESDSVTDAADQESPDNEKVQKDNNEAAAPVESPEAAAKTPTPKPEAQGEKKDQSAGKGDNSNSQSTSGSGTTETQPSGKTRSKAKEPTKPNVPQGQ